MISNMLSCDSLNNKRPKYSFIEMSKKCEIPIYMYAFSLEIHKSLFINMYLKVILKGVGVAEGGRGG